VIKKMASHKSLCGTKIFFFLLESMRAEKGWEPLLHSKRFVCNFFNVVKGRYPASS